MTSTKNNDANCEESVTNDLIRGQPIPQRNESHRRFVRQLFAALSPTVGSCCIGLSNGFTAILLPKVNDIVDPDAGSWLAGTIVLSMLAGNLFSSFMLRSFGRKTTLIFSFVPSVIGWIYVSFAAHFFTLLLSCVLLGFGTGVNVPAGLVYFAETCEPKVRGIFSGVIATAVTVGISLIHILGILLDWRTAAQICALVPAAGLAVSLRVPESPAWLLSRRRMDRASETFFWLRGVDAATQAEFGALVRRQLENTRSGWRTLLAGLATGLFFRPFFVLVLLFSVQQFSGLNVVIFHSVILLRKLSPRIYPNVCTVVVDVLRLMTSAVGCYLTMVVRRRALFLGSAVGTFASMVAIIVASKYDLSTAIMVTAVCCYICAMHSGIVLIPWLMNSELYPITIRDAGIVITTVYAFFLQFSMVKTSLPMITNVGIPITMSIYAIVVFIGSVILYFILPETKDKTLQEAGDRLRRSQPPNISG